MTGWNLPKGRMSIITGIAAIILGIFALVFPVLAFDLLEYLFAIFAIVMSASMVMTGLNTMKESRFQGLFLTGAGILGVLIGLLIILAPRIMAITAIVILGIWAIVAGLSDLLFVFSTGASAERGYKAASGVLMLIAGLIILAAPKLIDGLVIVTFIGLLAIAAGILTILFGTAKPPEKRPVNHLIYK